MAKMRPSCLLAGEAYAFLSAAVEDKTSELIPWSTGHGQFHLPKASRGIRALRVVLTVLRTSC